jgi:hypothetical protein
VQLLEAEKQKRRKLPIAWKNGMDVLALAKRGKEKAIADALNQHFIRHPLINVSSSNIAENSR